MKEHSVADRLASALSGIKRLARALEPALFRCNEASDSDLTHPSRHDHQRQHLDTNERPNGSANW